MHRALPPCRLGAEEGDTRGDLTGVRGFEHEVRGKPHELEDLGRFLAVEQREDVARRLAASTAARPSTIATTACGGTGSSGVQSRTLCPATTSSAVSGSRIASGTASNTRTLRGSMA